MKKDMMKTMKKSVLSIVAGIFVLALAASAQSGMMGSYYHDSDAIDPAGSVVVAISAPSHPIMSAGVERISLDSNHKWLVSTITEVSASEGTFVRKGVSDTNMLYCFDSRMGFCASAF